MCIIFTRIKNYAHTLYIVFKKHFTLLIVNKNNDFAHIYSADS